MSWRSIFYSISSTRISIKSALLGSNLYYYFTVGKARIRSACNFVIMVIVAILFKDSNHRFLTCPIIVSIKVTSLMNIHPLSNPCHCARRIKTNRSASRGGQKLVPTTFYSRSTSRIPVADNRASVKSWIIPAIHVRLKSCDPSLTIIERKSCTSVTPGVGAKWGYRISYNSKFK